MASPNVVVAPVASGVPAPAPHELRRERLLELLHHHRTRPLILLVAPAGFGKSTLAASYARDSGAAPVWLTLQPSDRDSQRFFARLLDTFEAAFEEPLNELRQSLEAGAEGVGLARALLADLAHAPDGFILVLDDFHTVDDASEIVESVDTLVRGLPEAGQVVITAREPPALSMTRLLTSSSVFPLGIEDLRFTEDETRELRKSFGGGDATLDKQAEGWVMGILLGGAPHQLGVAGGTLLGSYVEREVLGRLRPAEQQWLESMSVLDTITPAAAERLLGVGPWPHRLLVLSGRCPFLMPRQDRSYRLHALVREALLNRLRRTEPDRASHAWSVARQLAEEAFDTVALVRACQELGQLEGAIELIRRSVSEALETGRSSAALVTLELLPVAVRRSYPDLSLAEARSLQTLGRVREAMEAAEAGLQHGGRTGDVFVQIWSLVELATITFVAGEVSEAEDWLSAADHLLRNGDLKPDQRRSLEGRALGVRGMCLATRGSAEGARHAFENGEHLLSALGPSRELAIIQQNLGSFCNRIGDFQGAQAALARAASHWRMVGDRGRLAATHTILADMYLRLGMLESAGESLASAQQAARHVGASRLEPWIVLSLGQWHRACGRILDAVDATEEALRMAGEMVDRELLVLVLVMRAELAILQEDLLKARELLSRAQAEAQRLGADSAIAATDRALGRLHLADGASERAVSHLEAAVRRGSDVWSTDERADALYWLGSAYLQLKRPQPALRCLEQALEIIDEAERPALLASAAAEDSRLVQHGLEVGVRPVVLGDVERLAATRRPWTGVKQIVPLRVVAANALPRLDVQLFASFVFHRNGELVESSGRKKDPPRELLALLVLNSKGLPDEVIAEHMWPEMTPERALHNLQAAAYSLRHQLASKAAVRFSAKTYQLNPQMELVADVREFDAALARAHGSTGEQLIQALSRAVELYRDPLLPDVAWHWVEPEREGYRSRFATAALQLADLLARSSPDRSDALAERVLAVAPDSDVAYERLIHNARTRADASALRRAARRYQQAAAQFGFKPNPHLVNASGR
jgi:ATP/maltotriose-dependent transcriptional regulator MalT/DNA-binding SARP family transcriptional activator